MGDNLEAQLWVVDRNGALQQPWPYLMISFFSFEFCLRDHISSSIKLMYAKSYIQNVIDMRFTLVQQLEQGGARWQLLSLPHSWCQQLKVWVLACRYHGVC